MDTAEGGDDKHCTAGWIQTHCPFCEEHQNFHLGWSVESEVFNCWSCGRLKFYDVLVALTGFQREELKHVLASYRRRSRTVHTERTEKKRGRVREVDFPTGTGRMKAVHKAYLRSRDYSPRKLSRIWGLLGTDIVGDYACRIIAPITYKGRVVSYQGRDYSGKAKLRYKACRADHEARRHKDCLYGYDQAKEKSRSVVVVEGITDVWRLGAGAVATFGIAFTRQQVTLLGEFEKVSIWFDPEREAQHQAERLGHHLSAIGKEVQLLTLDEYEDPAKVPQEEAEEIMEELVG